MTKQTPSAGALRAAEAIQERYVVLPDESDALLDTGALAAIIDAESGLAEMIDALRAICDGASFALGGPRRGIVEIPCEKILAARAALAKVEKGN